MKRFCVLALLLLNLIFSGSAYGAVSDADFLALCQKDDLKAIESAIKGGANLNSKNSLGWTALMLSASKNPNPKAIEIIAKAGADVNAEDKNGVTALMLAATLNPNHKIVSSLISAGVDVDKADKDGATALIKAASSSKPNEGVITALIQAGADASIRDGRSMRALDYAGRNKALQESPVYILLSEVTRYSDKKFLELCRSGALQEIEDAVKDRANVNAKEETGNTVLILAARYNPNPDVVSFLIENSADITAKNKNGMRALDAAKYNPKLFVTDVYKMLVSPDTLSEDARFVELCGTATLQEISDAIENSSADINAKNEYGTTALIWASARNPDAGVVSALIDAGADVRAKNKDGITAMMGAAINPNVEVIKTLLGVVQYDVNDKDSEGWTPLMFAAQKNSNPEIIVTLIKADADIKLQNKEGKTALDYAQNNEKIVGTTAHRMLAYDHSEFLNLCKNGSPNDMDDAIKNEAFVNKPNENGMTPIILAAGNNPESEVTNMLLNAGANASHKSKALENALMWAAANNPNPQVIYALVKSGVNVNELSGNDGLSPLMLAASQNPNPEIVKALLDMGASVGQRSKANKNAAEYALNNKNLLQTRAYQELRRATFIESSKFLNLCKNGSLQEVVSLINAGADVNAVGADGLTTLMCAAMNQDLSVMETLISSKAYINKKNDDGNTALMWIASENFRAEAVSVLLKSGADVNLKNAVGQTALMLTARQNPNPTILDMLIKAGADINAKNEKGQTALMLAASANTNPEILTTLIDARAAMRQKDSYGWFVFDHAKVNKNIVHTGVYFALKNDALRNSDYFPILCASGTLWDVQLAIGFGANVNAQYGGMKTPLILAAEKNPDPKVVLLLIKSGSDTKAKDSEGKTALDYAQNNEPMRDTEAYKLLENANS